MICRSSVVFPAPVVPTSSTREYPSFLGKGDCRFSPFFRIFLHQPPTHRKRQGRLRAHQTSSLRPVAGRSDAKKGLLISVCNCSTRRSASASSDVPSPRRTLRPGRSRLSRRNRCGKLNAPSRAALGPHLAGFVPVFCSCRCSPLYQFGTISTWLTRSQGFWGTTAVQRRQKADTVQKACFCRGFRACPRLAAAGEEIPSNAGPQRIEIAR